MSFMRKPSGIYCTNFEQFRVAPYHMLHVYIFDINGVAWLVYSECDSWDVLVSVSTLTVYPSGQPDCHRWVHTCWHIIPSLDRCEPVARAMQRVTSHTSSSGASNSQGRKVLVCDGYIVCVPCPGANR